jgi:hypothetical protein
VNLQPPTIIKGEEKNIQEGGGNFSEKRGAEHQKTLKIKKT